MTGCAATVMEDRVFDGIGWICESTRLGRYADKVDEYVEEDVDEDKDEDKGRVGLPWPDLQRKARARCVALRGDTIRNETKRSRDKRAAGRAGIRGCTAVSVAVTEGSRCVSTGAYGCSP